MGIKEAGEYLQEMLQTPDLSPDIQDDLQALAIFLSRVDQMHHTHAAYLTYDSSETYVNAGIQTIIQGWAEDNPAAIPYIHALEAKLNE